MRKFFRQAPDVTIIVTFQLLFGLGHMFFFYVQENFYGKPNFLFKLSEILGHQTIATSFFVVGQWLCIGMVAVYVLQTVLKINLNWLRFITVQVGLAVYILYELNQRANPPYPDWHEGDIFMALLAWGIVMCLWLWVTFREKPSQY